MAWIELHDTLPEHPKLAALAEYLGTDEAMAVGHLVSFWLWATKYAQDGKLGKHTHRALARGGKWQGDPDTFVESMFHAGWLDGHDDGLHIHDWHDYAGRLIDMRAANRARMRAKRATHVQRTTAAQPPHVQGLPNQTKPNQTKPEEKKESSFVGGSKLLHSIQQAAGNSRVRWVAPDRDTGIESPERQNDTMAAFQGLADTYGAEKATAALGAEIRAKGRKTVADAIRGAGDALAKAKDTAPARVTQYGDNEKDYSGVLDEFNQ